MRRVLVLLCDFPPENPYVQFTHEINIMKGHTTTYLTSTTHHWQVIKKERQSNCHSQEEPKKTWMPQYNMSPRQDSRTGKEQWVQPKEISIR